LIRAPVTLLDERVFFLERDTASWAGRWDVERDVDRDELLDRHRHGGVLG
jgi:hypothetical protein